MADGRYVTVDVMRQYMRDQTTLDDDLIGDALAAAEQELDNRCARRFVVAAGSTARTFAPGPSDLLIIWDCIAVASVVENGVTLTVGADYQLEPLNGLSVSGESVPFTALRRRDRWWYSDGARATVTVTGSWGWASIPAPIREACKIIAKDAYQARDTRGGIVAVVDSGAFSERDGRLVRQAIRDYRRIEHKAALA